MSNSSVATPPVAAAPLAPAANLERRSMWGLGVIAIFLAALYAPTLYDLGWVWTLDSNYSHGFLVLPISLALTYWIAGQHPLPASGNPSIGALMMALGLIFHLACVVLRYPPIDLVSLLLVLRGLALVLGGGEWANHFLFPTFFLFFLFPLPQRVTSWLAITLQDAITPICVEVFGWFYNCTNRGNNIHITLNAEHVVDLYVAEACSGVRQLMAFVAMGALSAYFGKLGPTRGAVLMALSIPVAIFANVVRVLIMGFVTVYCGSNWLTTWMHDLPAMFTITLGIACFFGLVWVISPDETPQGKAP